MESLTSNPRVREQAGPTTDSRGFGVGAYFNSSNNAFASFKSAESWLPDQIYVNHYALAVE